eukprot:5916868-Amphidinium_carterae.1
MFKRTAPTPRTYSTHCASTSEPLTWPQVAISLPSKPPKFATSAGPDAIQQVKALHVPRRAHPTPWRRGSHTIRPSTGFRSTTTQAP